MADSARKSTKMKRGSDNSIAPMLHRPQNGSTQSNVIKVFLMNALVCMQAKKRRLHAVPSCGSDRLKLHFREGSVADISQAFWRRVKVQFELFYAGWLPASPQRSRKSANFWLILKASPPEFFPFMKMDPQKKIFRCAARELGGSTPPDPPLVGQTPPGAREAREARFARYISLYL
jgi:hypothetical protein